MTISAVERLTSRSVADGQTYDSVQRSELASSCKLQCIVLTRGPSSQRAVNDVETIFLDFFLNLCRCNSVALHTARGRERNLSKSLNTALYSSLDERRRLAIFDTG